VLRDPILDALGPSFSNRHDLLVGPFQLMWLEIFVHVSPHSEKLTSQLSQHALVVVSTAQDHARLARRKASRITRAMAFSNASRVPWRLYQR
jgi:hypothetical protein